MTLKTTTKHLFMGHLVAALMLGSSAAYAGNVGVDMNIHLGDRPQQVIVREPAYQPPVSVEVEQDINFVFPGPLGFYVAVGLPYDLFYVQNNYYLYRNGYWHRANRSQGPWVVVNRRDLPPGLRRHKIERIRHYRDAEYDIYRRDQEHYRGKHFRSGKEEWKEQRKEEKEQWKEEKRQDKEERKHSKGRKHEDD